MTSKQGCGSPAIVYFILAFSIFTSVANMCCIFYFLQAIYKVNILEQQMLEIAVEKDAGVESNNSRPTNLRGLNSDDADNVAGEQPQLSQNTWRLTSTVTARQKRDTPNDTVHVKCVPEKCRRKKRNRRRRRTRRQAKAPKVAAQFSGVASKDDSGYVEFRNKSPWVTVDTSPVYRNGSTFTIRAHGLHMVYAQILFPEYEPRKVAEIVHNRNGTKLEYFRCQTGLFIDNARRRIPMPQTCTVIGVIRAKHGDVVRVRSENKYAKVDTLSHSTYFGVIKLA